MPPCQCRDACLCAVQGAGCVDVTGTGTATDPYIVDLDIDPAASNLLSCGPDGLSATLTAQAVNCATVNGDGTSGNPLTIGVQVSSAPGNIISCTPQGLFAAAGSIPSPLFTAAGSIGPAQPIDVGNTLSILGSNPIQTTASAVDTITVSLVLDPTCNGLTVGPAGLRAPADVQRVHSVVQAQYAFPAAWVNGTVLSTPEVLLTNPSTCRPMLVIPFWSFVANVEMVTNQAARYEVSGAFTTGNPPAALPAPAFVNIPLTVAKPRDTGANTVEGAFWFDMPQGHPVVVPPAFGWRGRIDMRRHSADIVPFTLQRFNLLRMMVIGLVI